MIHMTGLTTTVTQTTHKKWKHLKQVPVIFRGGGGHINIQVPYMDAFYFLSPKVFFMKTLYSFNNFTGDLVGCGCDKLRDIVVWTKKKW